MRSKNIRKNELIQAILDIYQSETAKDVQDALKDIDKFIKKCILNKKHYFFKYNENNDYEFLLIINNMNELHNMLQKNGVYVDMGDYVYENNNSPINFKFNIDSEKVDIYISSKNILSSKKFINFINDFEENMKNI